MNPKKRFSPLIGVNVFLLVLLFFPSRSAATSRESPPANRSLGWTTLFDDLIVSVRATPADLGIPIHRSTLPYRLPLVERSLEQPPTLLESSDRLSQELLNTRYNPGQLVKKLASVLGDKPLPVLSSATAEISLPDSLPSPLREALGRLLTSIQIAQQSLETVQLTLNSQEKQDLMSFYSGTILEDWSESTPPDEPRYQKDLRTVAMARRFNLKTLAAASILLAQTVETVEPDLENHGGRYDGIKTQTIETPAGTLILGGTGDDDYDVQTTSGAVLIVDLGGKNTYRGPAGAAKEDQVRLVLDFGKKIKFESGEKSAGSGLFGIGMAFLFNEEGQAVFNSGDFSQGSGFFGTGIVYTRSKKTTYRAKRFSQGAACFGIGLLCDAQGKGSEYQMGLFGQGAGLTKGVGLLLNGQGESRWQGGFSYHDFREPTATLSFTQGVGLGPRGYCAGGAGLLVIGGGRNELLADYFAQGSAYFMSLGSLWIDGGSNQLYAKRYDQGAGVHTAAGALILREGGNRLESWWAAQGAAWDFSVAGLSILGNGSNTLIGDGFRSQADAGSRTFLYLEGPKNTWGGSPAPSIAEFNFWRHRPGYAFFLDSTSQEPAIECNPTLWSSLVGSIRYKPALRFSEKRRVELPDRKKQAKAEQAQLEERLDEANYLPDDVKLSEWVEVASTMGLDHIAQDEAKKKLLSLPPSDSPNLLDLLDHPSADVQILLRELIPILGRDCLDILCALAEGPDAQESRAALNVMRRFPDSSVVSAGLEAVRSETWQKQTAGAWLLGDALEKKWLEKLDQLAGDLAVSTSTASLTSWVRETLSGADKLNLLSFIGLQVPITLKEKTSFDLDAYNSFEPASPKILDLTAQMIVSHASEIFKSLPALVAALKSMREDAEQALIKLADSDDPDIRQTAVAALGRIAGAKTIPFLIDHLNDSTALVREASAMALTRFGPDAIPALKESLHSPNALARTLSLLALTEIENPGDDILEKTLHDPEESVRSMLAQQVGRHRPSSKKAKAFWHGALKSMRNDSDPFVQGNAKQALQSY